ncbi:unnamed protein product [Scytosiphon promiscuus]
MHGGLPPIVDFGMDLQTCCCSAMAFTIQPTFSAIFPARQANVRRRRRPSWTTPPTTPPAVVGGGGIPPYGCVAPVPALALLASKQEENERERDLQGVPPASGNQGESPPRSPPPPPLPQQRRRSPPPRVEGKRGHRGGLIKPLPPPRSTSPTPPPSPPPPPPLPPRTGGTKKRQRIPVPPLQRAFGVGAASSATASSERPMAESGGEGDLSDVERMQASIEELLGMQGMGSGSWNKSGGVPPAVEREQRTLVREIKALGRRGRWGDVLEVIARARFQGTELNTIIYGCAINAVGRCGRYREAVMLLEQMPEEDIEPDENTYKAAIIACSGANQWGRALSIFRTFRRASSVGSGGEASGRGRRGGAASGSTGTVVPGTAIYNAVITACARGLYTGEALEFFAEMGELGVPRDEASYNAAIDACSRGGLWQAGLDLLAEMQEAGLQPSLASYNAALDGCGREGRWEEAADLISVMRGNTFEDGIEGEEDAELLELLLLLDEGEGASPPPSSPSLLSGDTGIQPPPTADGTDAATEAGPLTAAAIETAAPAGGEAPFRAVSASSPAPVPPRPNVRSYNSCIAACRRAGQYGLARLFFQEMMSRGLRPDVWSFKSAILERAPVPPLPTATATTSASAASPTFPISETEQKRVGSSTRQDGPPKGGSGFFWREALSLLDGVDGEGLGPDPPCINLVLSECAKAGRWEESRNLLEDLREATPPGSSYRPGVLKYNSVLKSLRNASARDPRVPSTASIADPTTTTTSEGQRRGGASTRADGGAGRGDLATDLEESGGKLSGAEGWTKGHVSRLLGDMRAAGVTPNNETYQCAIRCATDAAVLDIAVAAAAERVEAVE